MLKAKSASNASKQSSDAKKLPTKSHEKAGTIEKKTSVSGTSEANPKKLEAKSKSVPVAVKTPKINPSKTVKPPPEDKKFSIRRPSNLSLRSNVTPRTKDPLPAKPLSAMPSTKGAAPVSRLLKSTSTMSKKSIQHLSKIPKFDNDKMKAFNVLKAKLRISQSQFYKALANIKDSQEHYMFVALVKNGEGKLIVNDSKDTLKIDEDLKNKNLTSMKGNLDLIDKKVSLVTSDVLKQLKHFQAISLEDKEEVLKTKQEFKNLQHKIEEMDSKNKIHIADVLKSINELADSTSAVIREIDYQELESKLRIANDELVTTKRKIEITEAILSESKTREQTKKSENEEALKQKEAQLAEKEIELNKLRKEVKSLESQKQKAYAEMIKLKYKVENMDSELTHKENSDPEEINNLKSELELLQQQKDELDKLYGKEKAFTTKLQNEVRDKENELSTSMSELEKFKAGGGDADNAESELLQEIRLLKFEKDDLTEERNKLEREKRTLLKDFETNSVNLQIDFNEAKEQLKSYENTNEDLRNKLAAVEESLAIKTEQVSELEFKYNEIANKTKIKQIQNELTQLRESDLEKKDKIKSLKVKLTKSRQETKEREEEIKLHQRVLKVRSELTNCLQDGEVSSACRIPDLHSEILQQNKYIHEANTELETKAEELQNLMTTFGSKQMEMERQENLKKLLEECKIKSQEVQSAQAERIEQLEKDVLKLKNCLRASEDSNDSKNHYSSRLYRKSGNESESDKTRKRKLEK